MLLKATRGDSAAVQEAQAGIAFKASLEHAMILITRDQCSYLSRKRLHANDITVHLTKSSVLWL